MNSHYFKRIWLSLSSRFRNSLLLFLAIILLSIFVTISFGVTRAGNKMLDKIDESLQIDINLLSNTFSNKDVSFNEFYLDLDSRLKEYSKTIKESSFDSRFETNILFNDLKQNEFSLEASPLTVSSLTLKDEQELNILKGHYPTNEYEVLMVNSPLDIDNEPLNLGAMFTLDLDEQYYEFKVVGIVDSSSMNKLLDNDHNPTTNFLMNKDILLDIIEKQNLLSSYKSVKLTLRKSEDINKISTAISNIYYDALFEFNNTDDDCYVTNNANIFDNLEAPLKSMSNLFKIGLIAILFISFLLLFELFSYLLSSRIKEYAIYISLGQSKLKTLLSFLIEYILIGTISISLSFIVSLPILNSLSDILLKTNVAQQERIAKISRQDSDYIYFEAMEQSYEAYDYSLDLIDYLIVYGINYVSLTVSFMVSSKSALKRKPKDLLSKNEL